MIAIKNKISIAKMEKAGQLLSKIFDEVASQVQPGTTTLELDAWIASQLRLKKLVSALLTQFLR